eukprot:TRINITY_DN18192_c0_g1_i1.p1 TRINITY_DN18192_c0_g1~~TRINITY_DN18192_c0_g1_i1.p1  ORF type:complete len:160 (+),score=32.36 TRINITY_DN18192_c0_g1_i1:64-543(+)
MSYTARRETFQSDVINAPVDQVWNHIKNFLDLTWAGVSKSEPLDPARAKTDNLIGSVRVLTIAPGKLLQETLLEYSETNRYYTYAITKHGDDASVFPGKFQNYRATTRVQPVTESDTTFITWTFSFDGEQGTADLVSDIIKGVFQGGFMQLHKAFPPQQ